MDLLGIAHSSSHIALGIALSGNRDVVQRVLKATLFTQQDWC